MNKKIVIETNNLSKKFMIGTREKLTMFSSLRHALSGKYASREIWALKDINIAINKGEMVAIIGPNGAGKTTLLRILSGIMAPTGGACTVDGEVSCIFNLGIGFNFRFTAIENVYLHAALHGISRKEIDKKMDDIIEFSGLGAFMGAKLSEFSSGMIARLGFSTVIQTVRDVVMVDEVLAVGDIAFQEKCMSVFENLLNEGKTVVFIAHGIESIKHLCSKGLYIDGGRQVCFGDINEVEEMYENNRHAALHK